LLAALIPGGATWFAADQFGLVLPTFFYQTLILVFFTTTVVFVYLYRAIKPLYFVQLYLLTMSVKIIAYGVYVYFMITGDRDGALANVVFFLACYVIFTILEITFLYRKISSTHK
jgi:hypothetical protein